MRVLLTLLALLSLLGCRMKDFDGDGFVGAEDCDPFDPTVYPGAPEICDGQDNNCNGLVDDEDPDLDLSTATTWYRDADGDGYGDPNDTVVACVAPEGYVDNGDDCDDTDPDVYPGAPESCDGRDTNCDGIVDSGPPPDAPTWYLDADGDGYGDEAIAVIACEPPVGFVDKAGDCDDTDPDVYPGAPALCDGKDNNCDGTVDESLEGAPTWYRDADGDGYGDDDDTVVSCSAPEGYVLVGGDCDDDDPRVYPGAPEPCGVGDRNCDGEDPRECYSCLDILENGEPVGDGLYTIDLDGPRGPMAPEIVWCDMTTDGGGWTLVQRTVWDWDENESLVTGYGTWREETLGDPAPGSAFRLAGSAWEWLNEERDHLLVHRLRTMEDGACAPLAYRATGGVIEVAYDTTYLTGVSSSISLFNAEELSTQDSGPTGCGQYSHTVPWFYGSCCSACPTYGGHYWQDEPHPMMNYSAQPDLFGNTRATVCTEGTPRPSDHTTNFYGVDEMEYYLR